MKPIYLILLCLLGVAGASAQAAADKKTGFDPQKKVYRVEAACGMCEFKMKGKDCALAIRWKGKDYYVDGTGIDDHGDAHAKDGFCNAVRPAKVQGTVVGDRFVATYFEVIQRNKK